MYHLHDTHTGISWYSECICARQSPSYSQVPLQAVNNSLQTAINVQVDLDVLKELAWSGTPGDLRPLCWQLLLGYLPPNRDRRSVCTAFYIHIYIKGKMDYIQRKSKRDHIHCMYIYTQKTGKERKRKRKQRSKLLGVIRGASRPKMPGTTALEQQSACYVAHCIAYCVCECSEPACLSASCSTIVAC